MVEKPTIERVPAAGAVAEAKKNPSGWVYEIRGTYGPKDFVPPHAVVGTWKVNSEGQIVLVSGDSTNVRSFGLKW